jgi:hypothetical protein
MNRSFRLGWVGVVMLAAAARLAAHDLTGFSASVLVDGVPQPEYAARGKIYVEALRGRNFTIRLANPTARRVAVALSVDGRNVIDAKRTTEREATKWILGPGETLDIPGWQISGETARKFFFTETASSYAKWLGDTSNVGTIEAVFFREKRREPIAVLQEAMPPQADVEGKTDSRPAPAAPSTHSRGSAANGADGFAATGIGDRTDFPMTWVAFEEESAPAARVSIRYEFRPELVRLGVLRPKDGLSTREQARGFEHDYAPDPDGLR